MTHDEHLARAEEHVRSVLRWLENDIDAGDEAIAMHRDSLYEALDQICHAKSAAPVVA